MSTWNEFCEDVKRVTNKAAKKTGELAHSASLHIKLEGVKSAISAEYERLGRLTYKQLSSEESLAEKISEAISAIDSLKAEEKKLREEIEISKKKD